MPSKPKILWRFDHANKYLERHPVQEDCQPSVVRVCNDGVLWTCPHGHNTRYGYALKREAQLEELHSQRRELCALRAHISKLEKALGK